MFSLHRTIGTTFGCFGNITSRFQSGGLHILCMWKTRISFLLLTTQPELWRSFTLISSTTRGWIACLASTFCKYPQVWVKALTSLKWKQAVFWNWFLVSCMCLRDDDLPNNLSVWVLDFQGNGGLRGGSLWKEARC